MEYNYYYSFYKNEQSLIYIKLKSFSNILRHYLIAYDLPDP